MTASLAEPGTAAERESLILEHLPQVRLIARRIHERLPQTVALDDLVSAGVLGLIAAVDHYDPSQGVKLKTYAEYKIRGAILDSLRELDWAPRQTRRMARQIESAIAEAEQRLSRAPTEDEIAAALDMPLDEYQHLLQEVHGLSIGSLEAPAGEDRGTDLLRYLPDSEENLPSRLLERSELQRVIAEGIERMPRMDRTVLSLYYKEELTLREIASVVHLHEARVSQLKSQAVLRLRAYLERRWPAGRGAL